MRRRRTGFLGDGARLRTWVTQLLDVVSREVATTATRTLQAVLVLDGADLLLPARSRPAAAPDPLYELLARAGSAGLGVVLASQRPAELDYRRCAALHTWFIGKTDEATLGRMVALFEQHPLGHRTPSRLERSRFVLLQGGGARDVERATPLLRVAPVSEPELKLLAARTHPRTRATATRRPEPLGDEPPLHVPSR